MAGQAGAWRSIKRDGKGRQCAPRFACAAVGSPSSISAEPSTRLEGLLRIDDALNPRTVNMVNS